MFLNLESVFGEEGEGSGGKIMVICQRVTH